MCCLWDLWIIFVMNIKGTCSLKAGMFLDWHLGSSQVCQLSTNGSSFWRDVYIVASNYWKLKVSSEGWGRRNTIALKNPGAWDQKKPRKMYYWTRTNLLAQCGFLLRIFISGNKSDVFGMIQLGQKVTFFSKHFSLVWSMGVCQNVLSSRGFFPGKFSTLPLIRVSALQCLLWVPFLSIPSAVYLLFCWQPETEQNFILSLSVFLITEK